MTPDQKAAYEAITGLVRRTAMEIAELPNDQHALALRLARNSIVQNIALQDVTESELVEVWSDAIAVVLRQIEASGSPSGGHASN
jgi:hypothetical protein